MGKNNRAQSAPPAPPSRFKSSAIAADIVRRISSGEFHAGQKLPPFRDLAKLFGTSLGTIQRAMKLLSSQGFAENAPYRRPVAGVGRSLGSVLEDTIAVVFATTLQSVMNEPFGRGAIYRGIVDATQSQPGTTHVLFQGIQWCNDFPAGILHLPLKGVLLISCAFTPQLFRQYQSVNAHSPVVSLDEPTEYVHSVCVDNHMVVGDATKRLIALGHRRLAFVRPFLCLPKSRGIDMDSQERGKAFVATCTQAGLAPDQFQLFSATFDAMRPSPTIGALISAKPRFTGIVAVNELHASEIKSAAKTAGLRIPQDLSVVTLIGTTPSPWSGPVVDFTQFGREGIALVCRRPRTLQHIRIPSRWNEGTTVGPAPS